MQHFVHLMQLLILMLVDVLFLRNVVDMMETLLMLAKYIEIKMELCAHGPLMLLPVRKLQKQQYALL
jgi:hypothetical protein